MNAAQEMRESLRRSLAQAEEERKRQNEELILRVRAWDDEARRAVDVGLMWLANLRTWATDGTLQSSEEFRQRVAKDFEFLKAVSDRLNADAKAGAAP